MEALISARDVGHTLGGKPLFESLSIVVGDGERLAILGANGAGKSTLLRMLAGEIEPDHGTIASRRGIEIGFVRQSESLDLSSTGREYLESFRSIEAPPVESVLHSVMGGRIGLPLDTPLRELSGGQRKRISVLREVLREPSLLMLDEPTNHLDVDGIVWLEELLVERARTCLFVSHDRYFIERVATRVVELDSRYPGGYLSSKGSYSDFLETREEYLQALQSHQASLKNKVRRETEWLRQGVKARTTKAKYRIDEAHRLISELNSIVLDERRSELDFSDTGKRSKELLKVEEVSKAYGDRPIVKKLSLLLSPGVRVGVVGPNGAGKTTVLRLLTGELAPDSGRRVVARSTQIETFSQQRGELNLDCTLKEALCESGNSLVVNGREIHVMSWAKQFLFSANQLSLKVGSLSGGEQARVLLARIMSRPADILFFDEPTNDLDIPTLEVLEESLCAFPGAVVLVSHDRHLVDRVSTTILGLPGDGRVIPYADYTQWEIAWREGEPKDEKGEALGGEPREGLSHAERKELSAIERKLAKMESQIQELKTALTDPRIASDGAELASRWEEISVREREYGELMARWESLAARE